MIFTIISNYLQVTTNEGLITNHFNVGSQMLDCYKIGGTIYLGIGGAKYNFLPTEVITINGVTPPSYNIDDIIANLSTNILSFFTVSGGGGGGSSANKDSVVVTYRVITAFTGASIGDIITSTQVYDVTSTPVLNSTIWFNQTTRLSISAPVMTNLESVTPNFTRGSGAVDGSTQRLTLNVESASGNITTQNLVPNGAATAGSAVEIALLGSSILSIQVTGTYTGALSVQFTVDGSRWETITNPSILNSLTNAVVTSIASATIGIFTVNCLGVVRARVTGLAAMTGTAVITLRTSNSQGAISFSGTQPIILRGGTDAASAATTVAPVYVGGRVNPTTAATVDTTLVAGDAAQLPITTNQQVVVKPFSTAELDFTTNLSSVSTNVTVQPIVPASGTASIRNYISSLVINTDAIGAAGVIWLLDSALTVSSIAITTGLATTSASHDLKIGDSIVFTALAGGTGVSVNTVYYVTAVGSATTFNFSLTIGGANVVPSVAYTGTTMYRLLYQTRLQTTGIPTPVTINFPTPLRGIANTVTNFLIPVSLTSGSIFITANGFRGF